MIVVATNASFTFPFDIALHPAESDHLELRFTLPGIKRKTRYEFEFSGNQ